ncbi:hypothetical protein FKM82_031144 [Ascaphus truei]
MWGETRRMAAGTLLALLLSCLPPVVRILRSVRILSRAPTRIHRFRDGDVRSGRVPQQRGRRSGKGRISWSRAETADTQQRSTTCKRSPFLSKETRKMSSGYLSRT